MDMFNLQKRLNEPQFNELITDNYAYHALKDPMQILRELLLQIKPSFGEHLELVKVRMAEPLEEIGQSFITLAGVKGGPRLKLDESNLYMVAIEFSYRGVNLRPLYVRLPYILRGGKLVMDGRTFFVTPVRVDRGVNLNKDGIFVPMNRTKTVYNRNVYLLRENNIRINQHVLTANLHTGKKEARDKGLNKLQIKPAILTYLFAKKGVTQGLKDYFDLDVEFYFGEYDGAIEKYPSTEYTIYSSDGNKPRNLHNDNWQIPNLHLVFKTKDHPHTPEVAASFFYVYDNFTKYLVDKEMLDSVEVWHYILGRIIFNYTNDSNAKSAERASLHLTKSVDLLLDPSTRKELFIDGIDVEDIYDLFAWLIKNEKASFTGKNPASLYDKRLVSVRYTLAPIIHAITNLSYALDNCKDDLTMNPIKMRDLIAKYLKEGLIRNIRKANGEVNSLQCPTDNIWFNISRTVVPQAKAVQTGGHDSMLMYKPENLFHESLVLHSQLDGLPKSDPTRKSSINPFLRIGRSGILEHDPSYDPIQKRLGQMLRYDYTFQSPVSDEIELSND